MNIREENTKYMKEQGLEILWDYPNEDQLRIKDDKGQLWRLANGKLEELMASFDIISSVILRFDDTNFVFVEDNEANVQVAEPEEGGKYEA